MNTFQLTGYELYEIRGDGISHSFRGYVKTQELALQWVKLNPIWRNFDYVNKSIIIYDTMEELLEPVSLRHGALMKLSQDEREALGL